jgi:hypothetical protein
VPIARTHACRGSHRSRVRGADRSYGRNWRHSFTYLRYNADLSTKALSKAGIIDLGQQERLRKLDAVESMPQLRELGARVGATIDLEQHFDGFL